MSPNYNPWHPITDTVDLKHLGKFSEELGECSAAVARCIIQGIGASEPITGKSNQEWLEEEIADVIGNAELIMERFNLNIERIRERAEIKKKKLRTWHIMA